MFDAAEMGLCATHDPARAQGKGDHLYLPFLLFLFSKICDSLVA